MSEKFNSLDNRKKGLIYIILYAISIALMNTLLKLAGPIPPTEKIVYKSFICIIGGFIVIAKTYGFKDKGRFIGNKKNIFGLSIRTICGLTGGTTNIYALQYLILSTSSVIQDLSVFFLVIFSFIFLKEKIKFWQVVLICVGFVGAVFVINPSSAKFVLTPSLAAIFGSAMNAGDSVSMRYLRKTASPSTIVFFYNVACAVVLTPFMLMDYKVLTIKAMTYLLLSGVCYLVVEFAITSAYKYAPAREIAIFSYIDVIFSAVLGFIVFGSLPTIISIIGYIIILAAAITLVLYNSKTTDSSKQETKATS